MALVPVQLGVARIALLGTRFIELLVQTLEGRRHVEGGRRVLVVQDNDLPLSFVQELQGFGADHLQLVVSHLREEPATLLKVAAQVLRVEGARRRGIQPARGAHQVDTIGPA
ncbi:hypothetical protein D9M68_691570 [compost metagenome]